VLTVSPAASVLVSIALTWVMLLVASLVRARAWSAAGMKIAFGNRDDLPEPSPFAGRADRAARNMLENLVLFVGVLVAAAAASVPSNEIEGACALFVASRLLYAPIYWAGIRYLRTAVWLVSIVAVGLIAARVCQRL
jgi:uncharacterized MAPEG superfamily protein